MPAWLAPIAGKLAGGVLLLLGLAFAVWWLRRGAKREERLEAALEGKKRSLDAHEAASRIKEEAREREKLAGGDPNADYPGGMRDRPD